MLMSKLKNKCFFYHFVVAILFYIYSQMLYNNLFYLRFLILFRADKYPHMCLNLLVLLPL